MTSRGTMSTITAGTNNAVATTSVSNCIVTPRLALFVILGIATCSNVADGFVLTPSPTTKKFSGKCFPAQLQFLLSRKNYMHGTPTIPIILTLYIPKTLLISAAHNECSSSDTWTALCMVSGEDMFHHPPLEMAFERDGRPSAGSAAASTSTTIATATSVAPPRTKKHKSRTKPKSKRSSQKRKPTINKGKASGPLSEADVGHHVATQYITGPGGLLRDKVARRDRMAARTRIVQNDASHMEQMEYLRKLDRHPALVLNADYQVRFFAIDEMYHIM